ncbi:MAG: ankyrin repeat domain-containing protein [Gemmatimonadaceae bacterium]
MSKAKTSETKKHSELLALFRAIASDDRSRTTELLKSFPQLALEAADSGATRRVAQEYYLRAVEHYVYAGDTALHVAAAAYRISVVRELVARGANIRARNRRGAEPLHYAVDGVPGSSHWNPAAQTAVIECLIGAGADPNCRDNSSVAPLHRAVRTRCAAAVQALLAHGADPRIKNRSGSTPLHLAVQTTGRGGSGTAEARTQQSEIFRLLLEHGARLTDENAHGKTVRELTADRNGFIPPRRS